MGQNTPVLKFIYEKGASNLIRHILSGIVNYFNEHFIKSSQTNGKIRKKTKAWQIGHSCKLPCAIQIKSILDCLYFKWRKIKTSTIFILKMLFRNSTQKRRLYNCHGNIMRKYHGNVVRYKVDIFKYKHTASKQPKLTASFEEAACLPTGLFFFKHPALSVPCMALLVQLWWMGERGESLRLSREKGLILAGVGGEQRQPQDRLQIEWLLRMLKRK